MPVCGSAWKNPARDSAGETWAPGELAIFKDRFLRAQERCTSTQDTQRKWINKEILTEPKLTFWSAPTGQIQAQGFGSADLQRP